MQTSAAKPKLAPLEMFDAGIVQTPIQAIGYRRLRKEYDKFHMS